MRNITKQILVLLLLVFLTLNLFSQIRVVCVGNSITEGVGATDGTQNYPSQLQELLGTGYSVLNCGVSARTMLKKGDFPYWIEAKFTNAKNFDPDIVIISLGTNDSKSFNWVYKSEFYSDYVAIVNEFRKNGKNPTIFVCSPPPAFKDNYSIQNAVIRDEIILLVDSIATTQHTSKIDYYYPLLPFSNFFGDGIHPNNQGAAMMATIANSAIKGTSMPSVWKWDYTDEASITSNQAYSNISALTDNDENTCFEINPQGTAEIIFEYPQKMFLNGCLFNIGDNAFNSSDWDFQYSTDKVTWTSSAMTAVYPMNKGKVFSLATTACRYFKLIIRGTKLIRINEFQLFGFPRLNEKGATAPYGIQYPDDLTGNTTTDAVKGVFSADDPGLPAPFNEIAVNAIDGVQNKYTVIGYKMNMNYTFNNPTVVSSYSLAVGAKTNNGRNPKSWKLLAADSNMQFNVIAEEHLFMFPQIDYCSMKFKVQNPAAYLTYRIEITGAGGENNTHISEWQLFGPQISTKTHTLKNGSANLSAVSISSNKLILTKQVDTTCTFQVIDITGKVIKTGILGKSKTLDIKSGMYVVRITDGQQFQIQKISVH